MTTDTKALRAQFEQYINPEGDVKLHWQPAGHYAGHGVQQSWLDFQAGHTAAKAETHEELARLRETLQGIADADWRKWEELATPYAFVRWAKSRAAHALRPNT